MKFDVSMGPPHFRTKESSFALSVNCVQSYDRATWCSCAKVPIKICLVSLGKVSLSISGPQNSGTFKIIKCKVRIASAVNLHSQKILLFPVITY